MNPVWRFKSVEWNENGTNVELTISGEQFEKLMDLCFFKGDELFLGTVTHERMCYAHILSKQFGEELRRLGDWEDGSDNNFARLDLSGFEKVDEP